MSEPAADVLDALFKRTLELHDALDDCLGNASFADTAHTDLTLSAAQLALEHAKSIAVLVQTGHVSSANVLLRAQLEATIRAAWFLCVPTDEWITGYLGKAQSNPTKDPSGTPSVDEMIRAIERKASDGLAPVGLAPQLKVLKDGAWAMLNSFVHSGIHPTMLQQIGYTTESADATLWNANGLSVVAAMLIALLSGDQTVAERIKMLQGPFLDCCPPPIVS